MSTAQARIARLLHITGPLDPGGAEKFLLDLLPRLRAEGFCVQVASVGLGGELRDDFVAEGVPVTEVTTARTGVRARLLAAMEGVSTSHPEGIRACAAGICRLVTHFRPDIIHTHLALPDLVTRIARQSRADFPSLICTQHDSFGRGAFPDEASWDWIVDQRAALIRQDDVFVAVSDEARALLCSEYRVGSGRVSRIAPGRDLEPFYRISPSPSPVVGVLANFHAYKGHTYAIDAFAQVVRARPDAMLAFAGGGEGIDVLKARVRELDLVESVRFDGSVRDVAQWLAGVAVLAVPSLSEGFPMSVIEAMASGHPVVAFDVGGLSTQIQDGLNGYLVTPRDTAGLAGRILDVLNNRQEAIRMGAASRDRAGMGDIRTIVRRHSDLYADVLSRQATG